MPATMNPAPKTKNDALKQEVLRLLYDQHNVAAHPRPSEKMDKLETFVDRAIRDGLTTELVAENLKAGRPPHWLEGEHSKHD